MTDRFDDDFFQTAPELKNQYDDDRLLRSFVRRKCPPGLLPKLEADLRRLGGRVVTDILALGNEAENNPPRHIPYDPWGRRIDRIEVSAAWEQLDWISAEEGLVALGYERRNGAFSRVDQFIRLYLFAPSSAVYSCPLAMTDGAARAIELYGDNYLKTQILPHLISRDPKTFWTSGQWMTERTGGSDVSGTSTTARLIDGQYRLHGTKWFTSATTSQIAITLARTPNAPEGSRGLSLFYIELRNPDGSLKNIRVHRLKEKLGTRALPTAELTLEGTPALLMGDEGNGVKKISSLFNITRMYNACCALGFMRRGLALARDYARKRKVFGKPLAEHPLHLETLADLQVELEAAFHLTFHMVELLGKDEMGEASTQESALLRLLIPVAKLTTAKQAISATSELLESFGGAGYIEDTGLPRLLRDSQVLSIWEGTTNVLSLDVLRAIQKENALEPFLQDLRKRMKAIQTPELAPCIEKVLASAVQIENYTIPLEGARAFAYSLARTFSASLLIDHAAWSLAYEHDRRALHAALRWCSRDLSPLLCRDAQFSQDTGAFALDRV